MSTATRAGTAAAVMAMVELLFEAATVADRRAAPSPGGPLWWWAYDVSLLQQRLLALLPPNPPLTFPTPPVGDPDELARRAYALGSAIPLEHRPPGLTTELVQVADLIAACPR